MILPPEVLERIADLDDALSRELLGVLTKLATYCDLTKKPVTLDMAEEAIGSRAAPGAKTSIEDIQRKTAELLQAGSARLPCPKPRPATAWPGPAFRWRCILPGN